MGSVLPAAGRPGEKHPRLRAILPVLVAELVDEIALFEENSDQGVTGREDREQQVAGSHMRRRPEGNEKAEEERMTDYLVEPGRLKFRRLEFFALEVSVHLPHPKQLEVVDEERRNENESPPYCVESPDGVDTGRALDTPDLEFDRSPLPEQDDEQNVGDEHVRAALGCFGDDVRPPVLESLSGHRAVLDGKHTQQCDVDSDCCPERRIPGGGIDPLRNEAQECEISHERDGVQQDPEKHHVGNQSIPEDKYAAHNLLRFEFLFS